MNRKDLAEDDDCLPGFMGGAGVNLLRDLETLLEVKPHEAEALPEFSQPLPTMMPRVIQRPPAMPPGDQVNDSPNNANGINHGNVDLYEALMRECRKEESLPKNQVYRPPPFVSNCLIRNDIRPLKKRSSRFPKAQYYCRLCDYHCDTLSICITHMQHERHRRLARMQEIETTLYHLPKQARHHIEHLNEVLEQVENEFGLSETDLEVRKAVCKKIDSFLKQKIEGCSVRLYGSCLSGFGLKSSSLNLDLQIPEQVPHHIALVTALDSLISASPELFKSVSKDFSAKIPMILFQDAETGLNCELSLNNHNAVQTTLLLRDYMLLDPRVRRLSAAIRHWSHLCRIDRQAEGTLPAHSFAIMLVFFLQRESDPVLPCIHDFLETRDVDTYHSPAELVNGWKSKNKKTTAKLLVEFFEFYALSFRMSDMVVSIRQSGCITKDDKQWKGKKICIEDPFSYKRSLTRSVNSLATLDFIMDCFKIAYLYFGTVQTSEFGPLITRIIVPDASPERSKPPISDEEENKTLSQQQDIVNDIMSNLDLSSEQTNTNIPPSAIRLEELEKAILTRNDPLRYEKEADEEEADELKAEKLRNFVRTYGKELTPKQAKQVTHLVPKQLIKFIFDADILTAGQFPVMVCNVCGNEGHLSSKCPDEQLPPLKPLLPLHRKYEMMIESVCYEVMHNNQPSRQELTDREQFVSELSMYIQKWYPEANLTVFGSSRNGFSFANSDLDICLTFSDHETAEGVNCIEVIEDLADKLKRMTGIRNVQAITSAKVPIIKFNSLKYKTRIEGDISMYNLLAQRNTELLRTYAAIDERVKVLGYIVKFFAKTCDIGDASRGSLSSYAYILMLLHFLQQVNPPVIPVLQELHPEEDKPQWIVDGWNSWFFNDLKNLQKVWDGAGKNKWTVTQLWIGFLQYYAAEFDDTNLVVCIRQRLPLTKFEKMWTMKCIAIEDPFELDHNLGAGISRKMNLYIKKAFINCRNHFGFMPQSFPKNLGLYLWDPSRLTDGPPPNDRGCRMCGKIGHIVQDCPQKKAAEERKKRERRQKQNLNRAFDHQRKRHSPQHQDFIRTQHTEDRKTTNINPPPGNPNIPLETLLQMGGAPLPPNLPPAPSKALTLDELEKKLVEGSGAAMPSMKNPQHPPGFNNSPNNEQAMISLNQLVKQSLSSPNVSRTSQTRPGGGVGPPPGLRPFGLPPSAFAPLVPPRQDRPSWPQPQPSSYIGSAPDTTPNPFGVRPPGINKPLQLNALPHLNLLSQIMPRPSHPQQNVDILHHAGQARSGDVIDDDKALK